MLNQCFPLYLHHLVLLFVDMVIIHNNQRILSFFFSIYRLFDLDMFFQILKNLWTILVKQDTSCKFSFRIEVSLKLFQVHMFIDWSVLILNQNLFVLGFESEGRYIYITTAQVLRDLSHLSTSFHHRSNFTELQCSKCYIEIKQHARRNVCIKHLNNWSTGTAGS